MTSSSVSDKVAIITGSSSGLGFETAVALARNGFYTYATMRDTSKASSSSLLEIADKEKLLLKVLELDVDSDTSVEDAISKIIQERGRIDIAVNNAGYALVGPLEETYMEEIKKQFDTNLFGALRVIKAVLPVMRKQRSGIIVNVTSMGGRVAIPLDSIYHGTKFALEGISESIRYETLPFGIRVVMVEPGAIKTNFFKNLKIAKVTSNSPNSPYVSLMNDLQSAASKMTEAATPAEEVANAIVKIATTSDDVLPSIRYVIGEDARFFLDAKNRMPDEEFEKMLMTRFFGNKH